MTLLTPVMVVLFAETARAASPAPPDIVYVNGLSDLTLPPSSEALAGLILAPGFRGVLRLDRDVVVAGEVRIEGGTLEQGPHRLAARRFVQTAGTFSGGDAPLVVESRVTVSGGLLKAPRALMRAATLHIAAPGIVRIAANGKLELSGDGAPLTGNGLLDTTTFAPTCVEFTGNVTEDVTSAGPAAGLEGLRLRGPRGFSSPRTPTDTKGLGPRTPLDFGERETSLSLQAGENAPVAGLIDSVFGFAYFATSASAGGPTSIVKIRLSDFVRVGALTLQEPYVTAAAIDSPGGFAYFANGYSYPGSLVKVRLSDFKEAAAIAVEPGVSAAVVDPHGGFLYLGTNSQPASVIRVRLADFVRMESIALSPTSVGLSAAVIDGAAGFAYFATNGTVERVRLSDFTLSSSLKLGPSVGSQAAVIDTAAGFAYFASAVSDGGIAKVRLSDFSLAAVLPTGGIELVQSAAIDAANGFAYFGTVGRTLIKVRLSDFTRSGSLDLQPGEEDLSFTLVDPIAGFAYIGARTSPGRVVRVRLLDFTRVDALVLNRGEDRVPAAAIDAVAGFAYFGTDTLPAIVIKVRLSDFTRVGALTLAPDESRLSSAVVDSPATNVYFGTAVDYATAPNGPGKVVRVRLSDFTRTGSLALGPGEMNLFSAGVDASNDFAYFGTETSWAYPPVPASIVKVRLSTLTRVGAIGAGSDATFSFGAVVDSVSGYAYFGVGHYSPSYASSILRIRLSDFTAEGSLPLLPEETPPTAAVLGPGFAYFGTGTTPGRVIRVRLADFSRAGSIVFEPGENRPACAVIDSAGAFAVFGTYTAPAYVVRVNLTDFTRAGALTLREGGLLSAVVDPTTNFAYFGANMTPGQVARVDLKQGVSPTAVVVEGSSICRGGSTTVRAYLTGTPPWSVTWSDGATQAGLPSSPATHTVAPSTTSTYTITSVSDSIGPGMASGAAVVRVREPTLTPIPAAPASIFPGRTFSASVPFHPGSTYVWSITGGELTSSPYNESVTFHAWVDPAQLSVVETDASGCPSAAGSVNIRVTQEPSRLNFRTLVPCRVFDSRNSSGPDAAWPALDPNSIRVFFAGDRCAIPATARALSANITVTSPTAPGNLNLYAASDPTPLTSTVNFASHQTRANNAFVKLSVSGDGAINVQNNSSGTVHFILDVNGYFE